MLLGKLLDILTAIGIETVNNKKGTAENKSLQSFLLLLVSCKYNILLLPFWLFVVLFKLIRESYKLLIMMEYNRHENRLYSYRIGRIRACRIVQMTDWKHSIKYLSVWFVKTLSKWLPFIFFHYTGYSKWRNCSSHLITTIHILGNTR